MSQVKVTFPSPVHWSIYPSKTSARFIAECKEFGLILEADSPEEIPNLTVEAMTLLMLSLLEENDFEQFFIELGWPENQRPTLTRIEPPPLTPAALDFLSVPRLEAPAAYAGEEQTEATEAADYQFPEELIVQDNQAHAQ